VQVAIGGGLVIGGVETEATADTVSSAMQTGILVDVKPMRYRSDIVAVVKTSLILEGMEREIARKLTVLEGA
jgi:hypothetical protein